MDMDSIPPLPRETTREYVYRFLKGAIMNLALSPGTALSEQDIANRLSVSRTPVREAFIQLSKEDLLDILPQKGSYVSLINLDSVEEAKFLRETLDTAIIKIACTAFSNEAISELQSNIMAQELCMEEKNYAKFFELNEAFHKIIFFGCKKVRIWELMHQMQAHYNRARLLLNISGHYNLTSMMHQHKQIVRAIQERDVELGMKTIKVHLNIIKIDTTALVKDYGNFCRQSGIGLL